MASPEEEKSDGSPRITIVQVGDGAGTKSSFVAPEHWLNRFHYGPTSQFMLFGQTKPALRFRTALQCEPDFKVESVARRATDPRVIREMAITRRITMMQSLPGFQNLGGVSTAVEACDIDQLTFVLRGLGDGDVGGRIEKYRSDAKVTVQVPLTFALQVIADVLRGLVTLDKLGIVHGKINWQSIAMKSNRAYIFDFSSACLVHDGDAGLGVNTYVEPEGDYTTTAYLHAPEMERGLPTGKENDVWAAGLLLGELTLGYLPVLVVTGIGEEQDSTAKGRENIRKAVRYEFDIERSVGWEKLPKGVQVLLKGMLEKDPRKRWTAQEALSKTQSVARELGITLEPEHGILKLPSGWWHPPELPLRALGFRPKN